MKKNEEKTLKSIQIILNFQFSADKRNGVVECNSRLVCRDEPLLGLSHLCHEFGGQGFPKVVSDQVGPRTVFKGDHGVGHF